MQPELTEALELLDVHKSTLKDATASGEVAMFLVDGRLSADVFKLYHDLSRIPVDASSELPKKKHVLPYFWCALSLCNIILALPRSLLTLLVPRTRMASLRGDSIANETHAKRDQIVWCVYVLSGALPFVF